VAIDAAKSEADALLAEYEAMDFQGIEDARAEMTALEAAKSHEEQLLGMQRKVCVCLFHAHHPHRVRTSRSRYWSELLTPA